MNASSSREREPFPLSPDLWTLLFGFYLLFSLHTACAVPNPMLYTWVKFLGTFILEWHWTVGTALSIDLLLWAFSGSHPCCSLKTRLPAHWPSLSPWSLLLIDKEINICASVSSSVNILIPCTSWAVIVSPRNARLLMCPPGALFIYYMSRNSSSSNKAEKTHLSCTDF